MGIRASVVSMVLKVSVGEWGVRHVIQKPGLLATHKYRKPVTPAAITNRCHGPQACQQCLQRNYGSSPDKQCASSYQANSGVSKPVKSLSESSPYPA
jgi:hypothetical protein